MGGPPTSPHHPERSGVLRFPRRRQVGDTSRWRRLWVRVASSSCSHHWSCPSQPWLYASSEPQRTGGASWQTFLLSCCRTKGFCKRFGGLSISQSFIPKHCMSALCSEIPWSWTFFVWTHMHVRTLARNLCARMRLHIHTGAALLLRDFPESLFLAGSGVGMLRV